LNNNIISININRLIGDYDLLKMLLCRFIIPSQYMQDDVIDVQSVLPHCQVLVVCWVSFFEFDKKESELLHSFVAQNIKGSFFLIKNNVLDGGYQVQFI
jgi:hypothetical protein